MKGTPCFALIYGPRTNNGQVTEWNLYFVDYTEYHEGIYARPEDPIYPEPRQVPLGTILAFDRLNVCSHSKDGVGYEGPLEPDRLRFVIYTEVDGVVGLLLPALTRTLDYDTVGKRVTEEFPKIFLPFSPFAANHKVCDGIGRIVALPTTVTADQPALSV